MTVSFEGRGPRQRLSRTGGLIWTLVRTDLKSRYHGTILGFGWALLKPVAMFLVLQAIFSFVFTADPDYRLNLIIGLFLWEFNSQATTVGLSSLHVKAFLLAKVKFPSWIIVGTSITNAVFTLAVFAVIILWLPWRPGPMNSRSFGLCFSPVPGAFRRHRSRSLTGHERVVPSGFGISTRSGKSILQAGFFVAPIIYPLSILPEQFHKVLVSLATHAGHPVFAGGANDRLVSDGCSTPLSHD